MSVSQREKLLNKAFRPHSPIEEKDSFFGREKEQLRVIQALHSPGQHIVIYGERGAGKTSLARVSTIGTKRIDVFCEIASTFAKLAKDVAISYQQSRPSEISYDASSDTISIRGVQYPLSQLDG